MRLNDTTRAYFERLAAASTPEAAARYNGLLHPERSEAIQEYLRLNEPLHHSMLRTSISPTMFKAGYRMNVIPAEAEATLDIRLAPGEDADEFFAELARQIDDDAVKIERHPMTRKPLPPSRLDTIAFQTLEALQKRSTRAASHCPTWSPAPRTWRCCASAASSATASARSPTPRTAPRATAPIPIKSASSKPSSTASRASTTRRLGASPQVWNSNFTRGRQNRGAEPPAQAGGPATLDSCILFPCHA